MHILALALLAPAIAALESTSEEGPKNVLYIVFDDLRPDLSPYGLEFMNTPSIQRLADTGVVFERAYAQQTVCSPSRMSFTTGRRPTTTKTWNFLNHFRQAECATNGRVRIKSGVELPDQGWSNDKPEQTGGSGQCCTDCSSIAGCTGWSYDNYTCTLYSAVHETEACPPPAYTGNTRHPCTSGERGSLPKWTPLPKLFKDAGYTTLGVGKYFHDGCRGRGVAGDDRYPAGVGQPPEADPVSWDNNTVQYPSDATISSRLNGATFKNAYEGSGFTNGAKYLAPQDGCSKAANPKNLPYCGENAAVNGSMTSGVALCDYVTYTDAIAKLRFAASERETKQKPFFMVVGVRRPHLIFRAPESYPKLYPADQTMLPKQKLMDKSINPLAYTIWPELGGNSPFEYTNTDAQVIEYRRHYYSVVSWADYVAGRVLGELASLGLEESTMVVLHADHGWHLGEYNMWEKRSLWENAARVPLVMRVPWLKFGRNGTRSRALVELVDVYKTVADVMGVSLPKEDTHPVEGASMKPLLESDPNDWGKTMALTMYPRCPAPGLDIWNNNCIHKTERMDFPFMGYSMRVDVTPSELRAFEQGRGVIQVDPATRQREAASQIRYTEWLAWNGTALKPIWDEVHSRELYNHTGPMKEGYTVFDSFENVNLYSGADETLKAWLAAKLRSAFGG